MGGLVGGWKTHCSQQYYILLQVHHTASPHRERADSYLRQVRHWLGISGSCNPILKKWTIPLICTKTLRSVLRHLCSTIFTVTSKVSTLQLDQTKKYSGRENCIKSKLLFLHFCSCKKPLCRKAKISNYSFNLPMGERWVPFSEPLSQLVLQVFASDTFDCHKPPIALSASDAPVMLTALSKERVHHSASYNAPLSQRAISVFSTEITSDLQLPGATSTLMNWLDVIKPAAKWGLRHDLRNSLELLL